MTDTATPLMQPSSDQAAATSRPVPDPDEIFRTYAPRVYSLVRRMLGNDADAEDVTQQVFVQVLRHLPGFRGESALPTWIHRIAVNAALAFRRKRAHREDHRVADACEDFLESGHHRFPVQAWIPNPEHVLLHEEGQQMVERAIATLPEPCRDVYVLADVEGVSNPEIAELLHLSIPAVKSRLHRARLSLRKELSPYFENQAA